jgi:hypothetical protein
MMSRDKKKTDVSTPTVTGETRTQHENGSVEKERWTPAWALGTGPSVVKKMRGMGKASGWPKITTAGGDSLVPYSSQGI